jgi:hypothetical protein
MSRGAGTRCDPEDYRRRGLLPFCLFVKNYGRAVIGNRLSYEGLAFVRDYVFPRPHADLLSVRGPYERSRKPAQPDEAWQHETAGR